ncbi:MAG: TPR end-of-group domain-containing protein [Planctomycetota bacterium]
MPEPEEPSTGEELERIEMSALTPLYEEALAADPEDLGALYYLGYAYTRLGRHEDGLRMDLRFTALRPEDPVARYNLACSFALLDRHTEAFEALAEAIRLGWSDPDHMRRDPDLASIRNDRRFEALLEELGS